LLFLNNGTSDVTRLGKGCQLLTKYSWCFRCPAQLRQARSCVPSGSGAFSGATHSRGEPAKQAASAPLQRDLPPFCEACRQPSHAHTSGCRGEHAIYGIHDAALRQQNLHCFHVPPIEARWSASTPLLSFTFGSTATLPALFREFAHRRVRPECASSSDALGELVAQIRMSLSSEPACADIPESTRRNKTVDPREFVFRAMSQTTRLPPRHSRAARRAHAPCVHRAGRLIYIPLRWRPATSTVLTSNRCAATWSGDLARLRPCQVRIGSVLQ